MIYRMASVLSSAWDALRPANPVDVMVDAATQESQCYGEVNWQQVSDVCDVVNSRDDGAKEAMRAIRRRLRVKHVAVQLRTLLLTQAMFDNCGAKFRVQLAAKDTIKDLDKLYTSPATDPIVRVKLYESLQAWSAVLQHEPGMLAIPNLLAKWSQSSRLFLLLPCYSM